MSKSYNSNNGDKVINPYAFVMLPAKKRPEGKGERTLTGKIECTLLPRTPLFIPNTTNSNAFGSEVPEHKSYDFYSYTDLSGEKNCKGTFSEPPVPVIPGSSIRGELRSLYETLTGSCLSAVNDDLKLYKRMPNPGSIGILSVETDTGGKKKVYKLYKATKYMARYRGAKINGEDDKTYNGNNVGMCFRLNDFREGQKIYFKHSDVRYKSRRYMPITVAEIYTTPHHGLPEGYVLKGEPFTRKHHFTIAQKDNFVRELTKREIEMLNDILELYDDTKINKATAGRPSHQRYRDYKKQLKGIKDNGGNIPVFYKTYPGYKHYILSPACISKEVYHNTIGDLLTQNGGFAPCESEKLCPACSLFGTVMQNSQTSIAGRVRVSDARLEVPPNNLSDLFENEKTLQELSGPKISSTEFYLRYPNAKSITELANVADAEANKTDTASIQFSDLKDLGKYLNISSVPDSDGHGADMWNYDFAFDWDPASGQSTPKRIKSDYQPRISGRKFYWQHKEFKWKTDEKTKRNTTIRALRPCREMSDSSTGPDYRFKFTVYYDKLSLEERNQLVAVLQLGEQGYHSLGHGKPLGLGSAKIVVDNIIERKLALKNGAICRQVIPLGNPPVGPLHKVFGKDAELEYIAKQVEIMTSVHNFKAPIEYPTPPGNDKVYAWFVENRGINNKPKIKQTLPELPTVLDEHLEDAVSLKK